MPNSSPSNYHVQRLRHRASPSGQGEHIVTSEAGEYLFLTDDNLNSLKRGTLRHDAPIYDDLLAKLFIVEGDSKMSQRLADAKRRTKKAFTREGQTLHLFVVTLPVRPQLPLLPSLRQSADRARYDMFVETAEAAVNRMFESPLGASHGRISRWRAASRVSYNPAPRGRYRAKQERGRVIVYTITSTLHHLTDDILRFFKAHSVRVSTSLDGPADLHNANRPNPARDAYERTIAGIAQAREHLGASAVSALTTLTRRSLSRPEDIVDEYVRMGFKSIFLRPLSPYGFAARAKHKIGYPMADFVTFYDRALAHILKLNRAGIEIEEAYAAILLTHILTPFSSGYVDLRSPAGAGLGVLVYNYDGSVYASDEGRMLAEMGDQTFRLGSVHEPYTGLMASPAMTRVRETGIAETLTGCSDCVFLPYCGADPVLAHAQGTAQENRPAPSHCTRHMGLFEILFRHLAEADPDVMRIFLAWVMRKSPRELDHREAA